MLYVYLVFIPIVIWGIAFHFKHTRYSSADLGHPGVLSLGTFNGLGETLLGGFTNSQGGNIYYVTFTILFLPIYPVKCVIASYKGYDSFLIGGTAKYEVFCKTTSDWKEILSIYATRWGVAILIITCIVLFL